MLHNDKLGQGLPISTIIIAIIGLFVLFIMIAIVSGRTGLFTKGLNETVSAECKSPNQVQPIGTDCEVLYGLKTGPSDVCCKAGTVR